MPEIEIFMVLQLLIITKLDYNNRCLWLCHLEEWAYASTEVKQIVVVVANALQPNIIHVCVCVCVCVCIIFVYVYKIKGKIPFLKKNSICDVWLLIDFKSLLHPYPPYLTARQPDTEAGTHSLTWNK